MIDIKAGDLLVGIGPKRAGIALLVLETYMGTASMIATVRQILKGGRVYNTCYRTMELKELIDMGYYELVRSSGDPE